MSNPSLNRIVVAAALAMALSGPAYAQQPTDNAAASPTADDSLYRALHGKDGIDRIVANLRRLYTADPRISDIFQGHDLDRLSRLLAEQICSLSGGPCRYTGRDMAAAHKNLGVQRTDFNALVEDLQKAMTEEGIPFRAQNRLLAKLAPMEGQIDER